MVCRISASAMGVPWNFPSRSWDTLAQQPARPPGGHGEDTHGLGAEQTASGKAIYTFDVPGTPLRIR